MRLRLRVIPALAFLFLAITAFAGTGSAADLLSEGRVDDALRQLKARISESPNDAEAYHMLSRAYYSLGQWDRAIEAGQQAVSRAPNNSEYHLWLGRAYGEKAEHSSFMAALGLAKKTRTEFETAVQLDSQNRSARSDLAEFYVEAPGIVGGGKDKARQQASQVAGIDPAMAHWIQARVAEKEKKLDVAENEFRAAIESARDKAPYWVNLASFYRRIARPDEMERAINQAVAVNHSRNTVLYDSAEMLFRVGRNLPAAAQMVRNYLASPDKVEDAPAFQAHYLLGSILEKQGNKQAAAGEYRAALSLASSFSSAQEALKRVVSSE